MGIYCCRPTRKSFILRELLSGNNYGSSMRIAFLVLNHREPPQLLRLLTTLRGQLPDAPIVVHHDKFRSRLNASALDHIGDTHFLTSDKPTMWGDFSLVDTCWRSIAWTIENIQFDWVILLSAQDYPIKPLATLGDYLTKSGADAILRTDAISDLRKAADRRDKRRRYLYQYRPGSLDHQASGQIRRVLRHGTSSLVDVLNNMQPYFQIFKFPDKRPNRLGWRARLTPFTDTEPCRFGSFWCSLSFGAAEFLVASVRDRRDFVDYYRRTVMPGESATATLIGNAPRLRVAPNDMHYTRWTHPGSGHPDVFGVEDMSDLLLAPEYFARKFDIAKDARILDMLDEILESATRQSAETQSQTPPPSDPPRSVLI